VENTGDESCAVTDETTRTATIEEYGAFKGISASLSFEASISGTFMIQTEPSRALPWATRAAVETAACGRGCERRRPVLRGGQASPPKVARPLYTAPMHPVARGSRLPALTLAAALACTGGDADTGSDTASACTDAAPLDCADAPTPDAQTELCGAREEADCDGPIPTGGDDICAWLTVERYAGEMNMCVETGSPEGRCVALEHYGDGCQVTPGCGASEHPEIHYRTTTDCDVELLVGVPCGYAPIDWRMCEWQATAGERCDLPYPSRGPALCNCAC
jgi:hypothetical protein